jgi:ABC-type branched-subunit amino acid transport system ATPase component
LLAKRRSKEDGDAAVGSVVALDAEQHAQHAHVLADAPTELDLRDVSVHYGGVVAVDGVSFSVKKGSIVGVIGPNGAGKTTLIDAISGFAPQGGDIVLRDRSLTGLAPHLRIRAGLGRTFQAIELYDDLSVAENVKVGLTASSRKHADGSKVSEDDRLAEIFALLGLSEVRGRPAGALSQGQRQLVSIARALAGSPDVLLLDEPAGGLDTNESHWLGERLRNIRDAGVTILLVDHDMSLVLGLCDTINVLNFGKVIASGTPAEIRADRGVAAAYLGTTHAEEVPA